MAYIRSSKGTPDQLLDAVKRQIASLGGDSDDITSTTSIYASNGSPEDLLDAVKDRIADLGGDIEACDYIGSASDVESDEFYDPGTGLKYWYFTKHGVMPGSVPKGLQILDIIDVPEGSYFLTDCVINTKALDYYDIKEKSPENIESCDSVMSSIMYEDCDGCLVGLGETISYDELRDMWNTNHEGDPSMVTYHSFEEWLDDTCANGYIKPIDAACNSCNIIASADLSIEDQEKLYEIADRYVTSNPVSGDWDTETSHEQQAIADELGISLDDAKQAMIEYLGFAPVDFAVTAAKMSKVDAEKPTYDVVEADSDISNNVHENYIKGLEDKLEAWAKDNVDSVTFEEDDSALYMTVTTDSDDIHTFTIPFDDISLDEAHVDDDVDLIVNAVTKELPDVVKSAVDVKASLDDIEDLTDAEIDADWSQIRYKQVPDSDGFYTDYTMYEWIGDPNADIEGTYICVFGDNELYYPEGAYPDCDFATDNRAEADEWFDSYNGFADDDLDNDNLDDIWDGYYGSDDIDDEEDI